MPNNPARHRKGFSVVASGESRVRRREVVSSLRVLNKGLLISGQELGSPNGGPSPTYNGGGSSGGAAGGGGGSILA